MSGETILVVDDDLVIQKVLGLKLGREGYKIVAATNAAAAMEALNQEKPDLMILNLTLVSDAELSGILDGFSLLNWIRFRIKDAAFPVIIHTADQSPNLPWRAKQCKAFAVFKKGESLDRLVSTVREALQAAKNERGTNPSAENTSGPRPESTN